MIKGIIHGSILYASNLPSYEKPHNAQIIYKIDTKQRSLLYLVRDADLVTIQPETFNLQQLIRGEQVTVKANVFIGHFERGGSKTYEDIEITFSELQYLRMLEDLSEPNGEQTYDEVQLIKNGRLLVHQIQKAPSYDHIVMFFEQKSCMTTIRSGQPVPSESTLLYRLSFCGSMKQLYFDPQSFQQAK